MGVATELWKPIDEYEFRYEVSSLGNIRRVSTQRGTHSGRMLKGGRANMGHRTVDLWRDGQRRSLRVCDLVAAAFCRRRSSGQSVHFRDGNPQNIGSTNLTYRKRTRRRK